MELSEIYADPAFLKMQEPERIAHLRSKSSLWSSAYDQNPEGAVAAMQRATGSEPTPAEGQTQAGRAVRQFGSGLGESLTSTLKAPFDLAEWGASKAGLEFSTGIDDSIEQFEREMFPEAETATGRIARAVGQGVGFGAQAFLGGSGLAAMGAKTASKLVSAGAGVETGAGAAAGAASAGAAEFTDNPVLQIGAGILAGGAAGIGIAGRISARRAAKEAAGEGQPVSPSGEALSPAAIAEREAYEEIKAAELQAYLAEHGIEGQTLFMAQEADAAWTMESLTRGVHKRLRPGVQTAYAKHAMRLMKDAGYKGPRGKDENILQLTYRAVAEGKIPASALDEAAESLGTNRALIEEVIALDLTEAARKMQSHSVLGRWIKKANKDPLTDREQALFDAVGGADYEGGGFWRRLENVRRGFIVSAMATAIRNAETQAANITVHTLEDFFERGINRLMFRDPQANPMQAFGVMMRMSQMMNPFKKGGMIKGKSRSFLETEAVRKVFRHDVDPLFRRYSSDVNDATGEGGEWAIEKLANWFNSENRLQEYSLRRAAFTSSLDDTLRKKGISLADLVDETGEARRALPVGKDVVNIDDILGDATAPPRGRPLRLSDVIDETKDESVGIKDVLETSDIKVAVQNALDMTWGREFSSASPQRSESIAGHIIDGLNNFYVGPFHATQVIPFPRFMMNALRWQWQHSPLGMAKWAYPPKAWQAIAKGDKRWIPDLAKASSGMAIYGAAHQIRNSEYAGEKWYEVKVPESVSHMLGAEPGEQFSIDTRAYNPFASYLFVADLMKRSKDGTLDTLNTRDVAMGIAATQLRAGAGLYALDKALDAMASSFASTDPGTGDPVDLQEPTSEKLRQLGTDLAEFQSQAWAGLLTPLGMAKDISASLDEFLGTDESTFKDIQAEGIAGPLKRRVPYASETLPDLEIPTQADAPVQRFPLAKLFGVNIRDPKNKGQRELDRLGFSRQEVLMPSGSREYDQVKSKHMGPMFEESVLPFLDTITYEEANDAQKGVWLRERVRNVREKANYRARKERPDLYERTREAKMNRRDAMLLRTKRSDIRKRQRELIAQQEANRGQ